MSGSLKKLLRDAAEANLCDIIHTYLPCIYLDGSKGCDILPEIFPHSCYIPEDSKAFRTGPGVTSIYSTRPREGIFGGRAEGRV